MHRWQPGHHAVYPPAVTTYRASGKIHVIEQTQQVSARFQKREFVVELVDNPRYPQLVQFQATGERCSSLDGFEPGDEVEIEFSLRGREWKSPRGDVKYFNSLDVRSIARAGAEARPAAQGGRSHPAAFGGAPAGGAPAGGPPPDDDIPLPDEPDEIPGDEIPF